MTLHRNPAAAEQPSAPRRAEVPFAAHLDLLRFFLARRSGIVEQVQGLLNAQRKPLEYLQDGALLARLFEDCVFTGSGVPRDRLMLRGQLEEAHHAAGFVPRRLQGLHNGLVDTGEMMARAFYFWQQTRWPGRNGRIRYAQTLFNLYMLRTLELLSMRVWDAGAETAGDRLSRLQGVLDGLWATTPADQPVLVRDARWLIQLAQSPATDDLGAYFEIGGRIATLPREHRIEIHKAGARMAAGHLRSQIRYYSLKHAAPLDDNGLVQNTRNTNALDFALLVQDLVPLLEAYEEAWRTGDELRRRDLADAICQGVSPDPELFLHRTDLLGAYSAIEELFVAVDTNGHVEYTPSGRRHIEMLHEYEARIRRLAQPLCDDCPRFRPVAGACSPYGVLYGFSNDLLEHMAFKTLQTGTAAPFALEDVFATNDPDGEKLAWVRGWRQLPHLPPDVVKQFDYPQQFAEGIFERMADALRRRAAAPDGDLRTGRLFVDTAAVDDTADSSASPARLRAAAHVCSSDPQVVAVHEASYSDEPRLLADRREGRLLVSYRTGGGWVGIRKNVLTDVLATGRDARIALPPAAARALQLMCPTVVTLPADGVSS